MPVWRNSTFDCFYDNDSSKIDKAEPCDVVLVNGVLSISYHFEDEDGTKTYMVYKGKESNPNCFKLTASAFQGRATLEHLPEDRVLIGTWAEYHNSQWEEGTWEITLKP